MRMGATRCGPRAHPGRPLQIGRPATPDYGSICPTEAAKGVHLLLRVLVERPVDRVVVVVDGGSVRAGLDRARDAGPALVDDVHGRDDARAEPGEEGVAIGGADGPLRDEL